MCLFCTIFQWKIKSWAWLLNARYFMKFNNRKGLLTDYIKGSSFSFSFYRANTLGCRVFFLNSLYFSIVRFRPYRSL